MSRKALTRLAAVWVLVLIAVSLQPVRPLEIHKLSFRHQALHIAIFAATAVVVLALFRGGREEWTGVAGLALLATGIEVAQFLIYRFSEVEWWDIREDSIGILLGLALVRFTNVRNLLLAA